MTDLPAENNVSAIAIGRTHTGVDDSMEVSAVSASIQRGAHHLGKSEILLTAVARYYLGSD